MTNPTEPAGFGESLDEMARSTDRLLATVDGFSDADVRAPSGLPGWTRAHVLTHLARQADGIGNLAHWARTGEEMPMYPGGRPARDAAIEEGAGRQIGDLRLDLTESAERLLSAFAEFPDEARAREVPMLSGASAIGWELPLLRIREVEIHHVDLAAGYTAADWAPEFATRTLDQLAPQFVHRGDCPATRLLAPDGSSWQVGDTGPTLTGPPHELAAWLVGRSAGAGLRPDPPGEIPAAPRWV